MQVIAKGSLLSIDSALHEVSTMLQRYGKEVKVQSNTGDTVNTLEIQNVLLLFQPGFGNILTNEYRKLTKKTLEAELLWYMSGNNNANIVAPYLKNWLKYTNDQFGTVASNYGLYWKLHARNAIRELINDRHSRRAVFNIYTATQYPMYKRDTPCTLTVSFNIRDNKLNMHVHMRSNDLWYGLPIDVFCSSMLHQMVHNELRETYPDLEIGMYLHQADSLHIYESEDMTFFDKLQMIKKSMNVSNKLTLPDTITIDNFMDNVDAIDIFDKKMFDHFYLHKR